LVKLNKNNDKIWVWFGVRADSGVSKSAFKLGIFNWNPLLTSIENPSGDSFISNIKWWYKLINIKNFYISSNLSTWIFQHISTHYLI
jgi:hypothetical protein